MKMRRKLRREQEVEKNKRDDKILVPMMIGLAVMAIGAFIPKALNLNNYVGKIIVGLGLLIMASSGYWQIKYKYIHGITPIRGIWAIIFSIIWIIILVVGAFAFIFLE
jgi:beta-lactamase regulating signal transducer with metallopeptidase domain